MAIQYPNSCGQGNDPEHVKHPLHATVVKYGYEYSHSTPVRALAGTVYIHHTYKHGEHSVGILHSNLWDSSVSTGSSQKHSGKGAPELDAHLKSKSRRYGLKRETTHEHK